MQTEERIDPTLVTILANRLDGIVREMSNTLLRAARSTVIAAARDFSCAIVTSDNQLLAVAEGLPIHMFGVNLLCESMTRLHPDLEEGDAFIHNDPYLGNSHPADQTILIPVFIGGEHRFTVCAKAHQADIGNSIPTTYHTGARDVYEEGALIFPCVKLQSKGKTNEDVIRLGMTRIRVPKQWFGDLLAAIGSARIGEKRLKELCAKYDRATIKNFIGEWFDYSERRMAQAISELPAAIVENEGVHDPIQPVVAEPIPVRVKVRIDPDEGIIVVDLRDNVDCLPCGLNLSEATATSSAMIGVFNCIGSNVPQNAGSFRRIRVQLREGSALGKVKHPHSASAATTNLTDKVINTIQTAFAKLGYGFGLAEGACGGGANCAVVSGADFRHGNAGYINQIVLIAQGGPASAVADGWVTFGESVVAGLIYRDSVELDEIRHPLLVDHMRLLRDSGGAGYRRGAPALEVEYGPRQDPMTIVFATDGTETPSRGVYGGFEGRLAINTHTKRDGSRSVMASSCHLTLNPGEKICTIEATGGGYGYPNLREPERVLNDVLNNVVSIEAARDVYQVAFQGRVEDESLVVDQFETEALRSCK